MSTATRKRAWPKSSGTYDSCQTPPYALDAILDYIDKSWEVWEPFAGEGLLVDALQRKYNTTSTTLQADGLGDFFNTFILGDIDIIISNPPYSRKYEVLERCYELGSSFALLMPGEMMFADRFWKIVDQPYRGIHVRVVTPRISFKMPNLGWWGSGAQFPTAWYCWRIPGLPEDEISRYELDKKKVQEYHTKMKMTQLPIMAGGGYNHIIDIGLKWTGPKPSLCGKHYDSRNEVRAMDKPVANLCPICEEEYAVPV